MKLNIYTIYDTASGLYSRPFFEIADAAAVRQFQDIATGADHPVSSHPEDYSLFRIGTYDDATAKIQLEDKDCLTTALECVSRARTVDVEAIKTLNKGLEPTLVDHLDIAK